MRSPYELIAQTVGSDQSAPWLPTVTSCSSWGPLSQKQVRASGADRTAQSQVFVAWVPTGRLLSPPQSLCVGHPRHRGGTSPLHVSRECTIWPYADSCQGPYPADWQLSFRDGPPTPFVLGRWTCLAASSQFSAVYDTACDETYGRRVGQRCLPRPAPQGDVRDTRMEGIRGPLLFVV